MKSVRHPRDGKVTAFQREIKYSRERAVNRVVMKDSA